jgi:hypothetical protein
LSFQIFCQFFICVPFLLVRAYCLKKFPFHIAVMRKSVSTYITLTNVTSLRTIYNIMSQDEILKRTHNIAYRIHTIYMEYIYIYIYIWQTLILYSCFLHFPWFYAFFMVLAKYPQEEFYIFPDRTFLNFALSQNFHFIFLVLTAECV